MVRMVFASFSFLMSLTSFAVASEAEQVASQDSSELSDPLFVAKEPAFFLNTNQDKFTVVLNRAMAGKPMAFSELMQINVGRCFSFYEKNKALSSVLGGFELKEESDGPLFGSHKYLVGLMDFSSPANFFDELTKEKLNEYLVANKDAYSMKSESPAILDLVIYNQTTISRIYKDARYKYVVTRIGHDKVFKWSNGRYFSLKKNDPIFTCYYFLTK